MFSTDCEAWFKYVLRESRQYQWLALIATVSCDELHIENISILLNTRKSATDAFVRDNKEYNTRYGNISIHTIFAKYDKTERGENHVC